MTTDTFETIHQAFLDWRQSNRRGPFPNRLKHRARAALGQTELVELGAKLGLTAVQVGRWGAPAPTRTPTLTCQQAPNLERDAFFEIQAGGVSTMVPSIMDIEVQMVSGAKLRVRSTTDAVLLKTLVACLHSDAAPR